MRGPRSNRDLGKQTTMLRIARYADVLWEPLLTWDYRAVRKNGTRGCL